jgi:hypothetical protein
MMVPMMTEAALERDEQWDGHAPIVLRRFVHYIGRKAALWLRWLTYSGYLSRTMCRWYVRSSVKKTAAGDRTAQLRASE